MTLAEIVTSNHVHNLISCALFLQSRRVHTPPSVTRYICAEMVDDRAFEMEVLYLYNRVTVLEKDDLMSVFLSFDFRCKRSGFSTSRLNVLLQKRRSAESARRK